METPELNTEQRKVLEETYLAVANTICDKLNISLSEYIKYTNETSFILASIKSIVLKTK